MIAALVTIALIASGAVAPIDDQDQSDLAYLEHALTRYADEAEVRRFHKPPGVMNDVHAEHLRIYREAFRAVHERRR